MIVRIKKHLLLMISVCIVGLIIAYFMTNEMREANANQLFNSLTQAKTEGEQIAYTLGILQLETQDYLYVYCLVPLLLMGVVNGYYFVLGYFRNQSKSLFYVFLAAFAFPLVGFVGVLSVIPFILYELFMLLVKKQDTLYYGLSQDLIERDIARKHLHYENDEQAQLVKQFMQVRKRNIFVFGMIVLPLLLLDITLLLKYEAAGSALIIFIIMTFVSMFLGLFVFTVLQGKNNTLLNTYIERGDVGSLKYCYELIMGQCTNDTLNATERATYANVLLISGDYDELREILKGHRIAKKSPVRWMSERRLAQLDNDKAAFESNGAKLRAYYRRFLKKDENQNAMIHALLLDLDIRDDLFYERYDQALEKALSKGEPKTTQDKILLYFQLSISYYHLNQMDLAKDYFLKLRSLTTTHASYKEIEPFFHTLM